MFFCFCFLTGINVRFHLNVLQIYVNTYQPFQELSVAAHPHQSMVLFDSWIQVEWMTWPDVPAGGVVCIFKAGWAAPITAAKKKALMEGVRGDAAFNF